MHAKIPLYVDMVRTKEIDPNPSNMVIIAHGNTPIQCTLELMLQYLRMMIAAQNGVDTEKAIFTDELINEMVLRAEDRVPTGFAVNANIVEQIGMVIHAYNTQPDLVIEAAKTAMMRNNLVISTSNGVMLTPSIMLDIDNDLRIHTSNGIEIGPIGKVLGQISTAMEFDMQNKIVHIKDYDPLLIGTVDEHVVSGKTHVPFDLALRMNILANDEGKLDLVIQACDDVGVVITHPIVIGTLDQKAIGELDPYAVPDATTEET